MTNKVPGVRARGRIPSHDTMSDCTRIGTFLSESRLADILLYVRENRACTRSDVYADVSKTAGMREKMESLEDMGLMRSHVAGRCVFMGLTDKGERLVEVLEEIERLL